MKMNKVFAILLALTLCLSLAACGGDEPAPAPDSAGAPAGGGSVDISGAVATLNDAIAALNEIGDVINANLDVVPQEMVDVMNNIGAELEGYKTELADPSLTQARLDEITADLEGAPDSIASLKSDVEEIIGGLRDLAEVNSYTEIPILNYIADKLIPVPADLVGSWWNFAGGFVDGRDMTQEEADAVSEAYGGYLACNFDETGNASITKEPYIQYGPYKVQEDGYTVLLQLQDMETSADCTYVGVFADIDGRRVMVMLSAADPNTALYMAEPAGDAG